MNINRSNGVWALWRTAWPSLRECCTRPTQTHCRSYVLVKCIFIASKFITADRRREEEPFDRDCIFRATDIWPVGGGQILTCPRLGHTITFRWSIVYCDCCNALSGGQLVHSRCIALHCTAATLQQPESTPVHCLACRTSIKHLKVRCHPGRLNISTKERKGVWRDRETD